MRIGSAPGRAPRGAGRPLAWYLGLLCATLLMPLLALEVFLLADIARSERARHQVEARDAARRIAVSLDRGLATLGAVAEVLASSDHLGEGDVAGFQARIRLLPRGREMHIVLRDAAGRILLATDGAGEAARDPLTEQAARSTGRPHFSGLLHTGEPGAFAFAVTVAVPERGVARGWLLSLGMPVAELDRLLAREGLPADLTATVTDREGAVLARSRDAARLVGTRRAGAVPATSEGWQRGRDADGEPIVMAFARSEIAGWTAWAFMPERAFTAPLRRSLAIAALVALLFAGLASLLALLFAHRITRPISALAEAAARGADAAPATPVREVNALAEAYAAARTEMQRLRDAQAAMRHVARLNEMGTLAAALAHEINQPLTAASTFSAAALRLLGDAAARDPALEPAREAMQEAAGQAVQAGRIVRRLRDFTAASDGERRATDLNHLVREAVMLALADARQRGISLRFDPAAELPPVVLDRVQIGQVLVNLVRNAVEAMDETSRRDLLIATRRAAPGFVEVEVADTGAGVAAEVRTRLFAAFNTTKPGGMGIGLAISRGIVEEHGGRLSWAPNPGGGSVFRFTLPVGAMDDAPAQVEEGTRAG
ncbi:ATP-binding protein [Falsiroseomonas sp.]|uniref:sensor histidine kinase n=1 Tax=Falsiroseomonas sp. TaxID=2870721 RepID=UPI00356AFB2E